MLTGGNANSAPGPASLPPSTAMSAPSTAAAYSGPIVRTAYIGKRVAIRMRANCPSDPGWLVNQNYYLKCGPTERGNIKNWIRATFQSRYGITSIANGVTDYTLVVTITRSMVDKGATSNTAVRGALTFLLPLPEVTVPALSSNTLLLSATYQMDNAQGALLESGAVNLHREITAGTTAKAWQQIGQAEQAFAEKIAATVVGTQSGAGSQPPAK